MVERVELHLGIQRLGPEFQGPYDLVEFDLARREVPSGHVERQAVLEGGPLHAALLCHGLDSTIVAALRDHQPAPELVDFVKMAVSLTVPRLQSLLRILRDTYGCRTLDFPLPDAVFGLSMPDLPSLYY